MSKSRGWKVEKIGKVIIYVGHSGVKARNYVQNVVAGDEEEICPGHSGAKARNYVQNAVAGDEEEN